MKRSLILATTTNFLVPLLILFSLFLLLRGHNLPGGGFAGGLTAVVACALYFVANGASEAKNLIFLDPIYIISIGLAIALLGGYFPLLFGANFFEGLWMDYKFPVIGKIGTPLIFDIGVYILVFGIGAKIILSLGEEDEK